MRQLWTLVLDPLTRKLERKEKHALRNLGITDVSGYTKNFTSQVQTRFGLFSLLYACCLDHFEAIPARFSDFPAPVINSKGQRSYCATKSYFLLAALLHMQKLRPAKRVIIAFKVPQINCSSFTKGYFEGIPSFKLRFPKNVGWTGPLSPSTPTSFANYRFSFSKIQIFIS